MTASDNNNNKKKNISYVLGLATALGVMSGMLWMGAAAEDYGGAYAAIDPTESYTCWSEAGMDGLSAAERDRLDARLAQLDKEYDAVFTEFGLYDAGQPELTEEQQRQLDARLAQLDEKYVQLLGEFGLGGAADCVLLTHSEDADGSGGNAGATGR